MKYIFIILASVMLFAGCAKEKTELCFVSKESKDGNIRYVYEYDSDNQISLIRFFDENVINIINGYPEYQFGKLKNLTYQYEPVNQIYYFFIVGYNPAGMMNYISMLEDVNDDGFAETLSFSFQFKYNTSGKVDTVAVFNSSFNLVTTLKLIWNGENVSRINYANGAYAEYTYDNSPNRFQQNMEIFMVMKCLNLHFEPLSANNITSIKIYDSSNQLQTDEYFAYTYDNDGKVISINGNETIDYRCIEQE